jgi:hypothetical protein
MIQYYKIKKFVHKIFTSVHHIFYEEKQNYRIFVNSVQCDSCPIQWRLDAERNIAKSIYLTVSTAN